jgi:hypothetical protein
MKEKLEKNNIQLKLNRIPRACPLRSQCQQTAVHKNIVKFIKAKSPGILSCPDIWERVSNCPHVIEDAFYVGVISDEDLLHYLECEIFSLWFWEKRKQEGTEMSDEVFNKSLPSHCPFCAEAFNQHPGVD